MNKPKIIIIKKVKKGGGGGGHGGSWKVAYADFVTAMMAFFLLLWLLSMVSQEKRIQLTTYFKHFTIFEQSGSSFMAKSSEMLKEAGEAPKTVATDLQAKSIAATMKPEEFKEAIKKAIEEKLGDIKNQILIDTVEGGVRIQLVDSQGQPMFELGSSQPTPLALRILQVIGDNIKNLPNPASVEGHTDSVQYRSTAFGNWELSTQRALAARKELETYGLIPSRITRVAGYADTSPLIKEDTEDPRNRRISIILFFPQKQ